MKPLTVLGIYREQIFSPGKIEDDAAIMDATVEELSRLGWEIRTLRAESISSSVARSEKVLSMAQSDRVLNILHDWSRQGSTVINTVTSVRNCYRKPLTHLLSEASICVPPSRVVTLEEAEEKISLRLTLDKPAYRPGEAVLATVEVTNNTPAPLQALALNAKSLVFVFGKQDDPERMERQAVASEQEKLDEAATLAPGQPARRQFVLTRLSEFPGPLVLQVQYRPGGEAATRIAPKIFSNPVQYQVAGARLLRRDPEGFILKEEALRLARAAYKGQTEEAQAVFVRDEAGFYRWWVNLKPKGAAPGGLVGYFVNPYLGGAPKAQAKPFDPQLARDARFARPANLPPMPMPALVTQGGR